MPLRFLFGLHNHQPVGNFDDVFEQAYRDGYRPFLDLIEEYPEISFTLHTSGPLLEWLEDRHPDYLDRLKHLAARGQCEILGGAYYEPILSMIPRRDALGQIRSYAEHLESLFDCRVRGMWLAERVWEPALASVLVEAGMEYTLLDDYHFRQAGVSEEQLYGYHLTEDEGRLLRIFPISETMRYLVPWKDPEESIGWLGELAQRHPGAVVVCADDGEKFGGWPETHTHCYTNGWLRRFFELLRRNLFWIKPCTLSQALDQTTPVARTYLPDCSYREMTEWALPTSRLQTYKRLWQGLERDERFAELRGFLRGGFWRNFRAKYPEANEMYCRILEVSRAVREAEEVGLPEAADAKRHLYRSQCNCAHWHGAFGGLYLPHLRNAVYENLLAAETELRSGANGPAAAEAVVADFDLDLHPEVSLGNNRLRAYFAPHRGGCMYELDVYAIARNLLATLSRRPEVYHQTILQAAGLAQPHGGERGLHEQVKFKQPGLESLLQYDHYLRKSLIDHFWGAEATLADVAATRATERGDFVSAPYHYAVNTSGGRTELILRRQGAADGAPISVSKRITLRDDDETLDIGYRLDNLPTGRTLHFAVEFNFAALAANADDRYFYTSAGNRAGQLQTRLDLIEDSRLGLVDEWLGLSVCLSADRPTHFWTFPIQTVSQSEGGFELVHQSVVVMPHWLVQGDAAGRWEVRLCLNLDASRARERLSSLAGGSR